MRIGSIATASLVLLAACRSAPSSGSVLAHTETWCPDGFEVGPQDTCFAVPEATTERTPILVYLHGMYAGRGSPEEWAAVRAATQRGFAVVLPRGKRGLCAWKAELKDHFCWPTETEDPRSFKAIVAEWDRVLWQVEALLEPGRHRRYVLGFSNGGLFAEYIAARGIFPAQGFAIVNGGTLVAPTNAAGAPPMLLVSAQQDPGEPTKMRKLHETLERAGWAHAWCPRPGDAALSGADVDAALRFFRRDAEGSLKVQNGMYSCDGRPPAAASSTAPALMKPPAHR